MSDTGPKTGLSAAVDLAMAQTEAEQPAEQLPLMALEPVAAPDGQAPGEAQRGAGRPPGAINKRTQDWAAFILARYSSPLICLAEIATRSVEQLVKDLGCDKLEALKLKREAAKDLAPYLHSKMPIGVDVTSRKDFTLTIVEPGEAEQGMTEGDDVVVLGGQIIDVESEGNQ